LSGTARSGAERERPVVRAAAVQMTSGTDVVRNLAEAGRLIAQAAAEGADLVVLPENFSFLGAQDAERLAAAEAFGDGPAQAFLREQASARGVWIVGGTIPIRQAENRASSRSLLVDPSGDVRASYDKIHLFDVVVPGGAAESYRESATTIPGATPVVAETELGRIGLSVCYDLRFPALFHRLGALGAEIIVLPAAFTVPTGRVHWQPLLTARAVESLGYVVASGQWGEHAGGRRTYGHSLIVGPWGETLAECPDGAGVAMAELDMIRLDELRKSFPALEHRREL
jgi:deaminated glutathione amidase